MQPSWFAEAKFWTTFNGEPGSSDITDNVKNLAILGRRAEHAFEAPAKRSTKQDDVRQMRKYKPDWKQVKPRY